MISRRRVRGQPKLKKEKCEVCGLKEPKVLDIHHIIPRCDERCNNNNGNLVCLCATCHRLVHCGEVVILGVYFGTNGRTLVWHKKNEKPPFEEEFWKIRENHKVVLR